MSEFDERSYDEILAQMNEDFKEKSGFYPDNASDVGIRIKVLAAQIFSLNHKLNFAWRQSSPLTASGEYLERHAYEKGISRKVGAKAKGKIRFFVETALGEDKAIEKGTLLATNTFSDAVKFQTSENAVLPSGETEILVPAEALDEGTGGNVSAFSVKVIENDALSCLSAENPEPFSGGASEETDENLRQRIVSAYRLPAMNGNESYYVNMALRDAEVMSASVVPLARGAGTADVVIATAEPLPSSEILARVQSVFNSNKEFGIDVEVTAPSIDTLDFLGDIIIESGCSSAEVSAECEAVIRNYTDSLGVGKSFIKADLFRRIMDIDGTKNIEIYNPNGDYFVSRGTLIRCGNINLNIIK